MAEDNDNDFPCISQGKNDPPQWEERLFKWKNNKKGKRNGTVTLTELESPPKTFHARFDFEDGEDVEYEGPIPGNGSWKGKNRVGFRKGSGKFKDRNDEIDVDSSNPKRWG